MDTEAKSAVFEVSVLGPVSARRDGTKVDVAGKPALLVALLVAGGGDVVAVDTLIDGMWGDEPPATARKAVQVNVSYARRALGGDFPLETVRGGYVIATDNLIVDAHIFRAAVDEAAKLIDGSPLQAVDVLGRALALWRGTPYADFAENEALRGQIVLLNEQRVRAKQLLFDARLRLGEHLEVIGELDAAAFENPYYEGLRRLHMIALYRSGRQTEALRAFDRTRNLLLDAGLEPSAELRDLYQQVLNQDPALDLQADVGRPSADTPAAVGHAVRGYELREPLSESADGKVYRAYQAAVGREVAIKVVPSTTANQADFVKRFEAEARLVAQLEHPHIVPLYDFWRDPAGAYLVMQWPSAGSVADSLANHLFEPPAVVRVVGQIGAALSYAHRHGVFHGDLRPSNVLLDDDGNGYLADFSVASQVPIAPAYAAPEVLAGQAADGRSEVYSLSLLVNEMLTRTRPDLGARLAASAGGEVADGLPPGLRDVLATGTAADPDERYQRIDDLVRAIRQVFGADVTTGETAPPAEVRNPYKGLRAFAEVDAADFFGRDQVVSELTSQITSSRLVAVVGPSGSGKSSLVRAGLLPVVRKSGFATDRDVVIAEMFPGSYPFEELEAALTRVAVHRPPAMVADLLADDRGLLRASKQVLPDDNTDLLLVIDQFEELFSLTADETVRRAFLDNLVAVATDERSRVRVVLTMRADFFDRPLEYPEFGEQLSASLVTVAMPGHDELAQAIAAPARGAGLELEAGLVSVITRDVADEPGALPLMQYALTELAEAREGRNLTIAGYEETGGVIRALSRRAEDIYTALPAAAQSVVEELFVQLVAVGEDSDDTRRRVRRSELDSLGLNANALTTVLADYGSFRLLSFDRDPVTRGQTVEVAHEALIREWPRYQGWIDERRESLIMQRRLEAAATEWEANDQQRGFLFSGGRLDHYEQWADTPDARLGASERALLAESRTFENDRIRRERTRRRRVLMLVCSLAAIAGLVATIALVQQRRAEDATDLAAANAALAETRATEAQANANLAEGRALVAEVETVVDEDPQLALLLSIEAAKRLGDVPQATSALHESLAAQRTIYEIEWSGNFGNGSEVDGDLSADGKLLAVVGPTGSTVEVHDVDRGELLWSYSFPVDRPQDYQVMAQFIGQGQELLLGISWHPAGDRAHDAPSPLLGFHVVDSSSGELLRRYDGGPCGPVGARVTSWAFLFESGVSSTMTAGISQAWFDEHGCWPAHPPAGDERPYPEIDIERVDLSTGESVPIIAGWDGGTLIVAMSADGKRAGLGWNGSPPGTFTVLDIDSGEVVNEIDKLGRSGGSGLFLDLDGSVAIAQGATDGEILHFDVESGELLAEFADPDLGLLLTNAGFSSDNSRYYTTNTGGTLTVYSANGDVEVAVPTIGPIGVVRGTADMERVATFGTSRNRTVTVLGLSGLPEATSFDPCADAYLDRTFFVNRGLVAHEDLLTVFALCDATGTGEDLPFGTTVGAPFSPGYAYTYSIDSGDLVARHQAMGQAFAVASASTAVIQTWSGDGRDSWVGGEVSVVDLRTGEQAAVLEGLCALPLALLLSDEPDCDGAGLALHVGHIAISGDATIVSVADVNGAKGRAWNRVNGSTIDLQDPIGALGISPDGSVLVAIEQFDTQSGGIGTVRLYRTSDFELIAEVTGSPEVAFPLGDAIFAPNGEAFAVLVGNPATALRIHDADTGEVIARRSDLHEGATMAFAYSADSSRLATVGSDGFARVWDATTFGLLEEIDVGGFVTAVTFVDSDNNLAVATRTGDVRIYHLELNDMLELARQRVRRGFTNTECTVYFPDTACPALDEILNEG